MTTRHALLLALAMGPGAALAQSTECGVFPQTGASYGCTCAAGATAGPVWGSGPYTADSDICTAARHAGVLGQEGGTVVAQAVEAPPSFRGTASNGVTSLDYGPYPRAFVLEGAILGAGTPPCTRLGPDKSTVCGCTAGPHTGSVWGSDPYTDDSDICTAAQHAGVLPEGGGQVTVRRIGGFPSYEGSMRNGVESRDFGEWGGSFTFSSKD